MGIADAVLAAEGGWLMGRYVPRAILGHIAEHLADEGVEDADAIIAAVRRGADQLIEEDADLVIDAASRGELGMSAVTLAAYRELEPRVGDARAKELLSHAFARTLAGSMHWLGHQAARGGIDGVEAAWRRASAAYGPYFEFEFTRPGDGSFEIIVRRCFFRDFMARHDALDVTTVICVMDGNWMSALHPDRDGLVAERTQIMSLGDEACRFCMRPCDDPAARMRDVLGEHGGDPG